MVSLMFHQEQMGTIFHKPNVWCFFPLCSYLKLVISWYYGIIMVTMVRFHCEASLMFLQNWLFLSIDLSFQDQFNFKLSESNDNAHCWFTYPYEKSASKKIWTFFHSGNTNAVDTFIEWDLLSKTGVGLRDCLCHKKDVQLMQMMIAIGDFHHLFQSVPFKVGRNLNANEQNCTGKISVPLNFWDKVKVAPLFLSYFSPMT